MVLSMIKFVLFLMSVLVDLLYVFMSLLKVILCLFGLLMLGEIEVVWFVGLSIFVMKWGLLGVFVVNLLVVLCVNLVVVKLILWDWVCIL